MAKAIDLTGQKFGKLTVIERDLEYNKKHSNKNGYAFWLCKCDCGNFTSVAGPHLREGSTKSCGCLKKEIDKQKYKDLKNQRFGKLTALTPLKGNKEGRKQWLCECDCGNVVIIPSNSLLSGNTKSCGCLKSHGEEKICNLLKSNNIDFVRQKTFSDCYIQEGYPLRFDFYINNSFLLEFDGIQHYVYGIGWNSLEEFQKNQQYDNFKNEYCKNKNIPLKRIPYWDLESLTIEDLLSEKYLV